ncbi:PASTA domain-containing penicillin-binding protein [Clostridium sp.]|uniref:PASTA domain-containing penicillin-binding protein n=1 Tax=Clostridium sp. TaxID=1506 RepID=UPI001B7B2B5F|nr:PASTA domain-containing penicillin-binding protein [Clostridium sp.]MBP3915463.1 PASTA domain-containing protein [Clostridium sp.]
MKKKIDAQKIRENRKKEKESRIKSIDYFASKNIKKYEGENPPKIKNKKYSKARNFFSKRLTWVILGVCTVFTGLIIRYGQIMIIKSGEYKEMSEKQWKKELEISPKRGDIYDRNGIQLARTSNVYRADLDLEAINNYCESEDVELAEVVRTVADILELDYEEANEMFNSKYEDGSQRRFVVLARRIEKSIADELEDTGIYGINISSDTKRFYPNDNFLAQTLGSIGSDGTPLSGIELYYDDVLSGRSGVKIAGLDGVGRQLPYITSTTIEPVNGSNLTLTIDENIQYFAETIAQKGLDEHKAKRVSILVMNPNNGEVLAMASKPDFNPNEPYEGAENYEGEDEITKIQNMWKNSLVSDVYEPGSTFKNITMMAALEEGVVNEHTSFNCTGGEYFGSTYVGCWQTWGHGQQNLPDILMNSCNVGFMKLGELLGKERLNKYIEKYGFGSATGLDLPGEAEGIVKPTESIAEIDLGTISFGQTNSITAFQLMTAFNAIANGGTFITPHVMKEVSHVNSEGITVIDEVASPNIRENMMSKESASTLREYLEITALQGGEPGSFMEGYNVGIKSGTGQKVDPEYGGYSATKYLASVIGLVPVENPNLTVYVLVDEPSTGVYYGGQVATPILKELLSNILPYTESIPTYFTEKDEYAIIPDVREQSIDKASEILSQHGIKIKIEGNGNIVNELSPLPGSTVKSGTTIIGYTDSSKNSQHKEICVPDLIGLTISEATEILNSLELNVSLEGYGVVQSQSIEKNSTVKKGTEILLTLAPKEL